VSIETGASPAGGIGAWEVIRSLLFHTQALDGLVIAGMMGSLLVAAWWPRRPDV